MGAHFVKHRHWAHRQGLRPQIAGVSTRQQYCSCLWQCRERALQNQSGVPSLAYPPTQMGQCAARFLGAPIFFPPLRGRKVKSREIRFPPSGYPFSKCRRHHNCTRLHPWLARASCRLLCRPRFTPCRRLHRRSACAQYPPARRGRRAPSQSVILRRVIMSSIYLGGSRHLSDLPIVGQFTSAIRAAGFAVHVGCQFGADAAVINSCVQVVPFSHKSQIPARVPSSSLVVFAVAPNSAEAPPHVWQAEQAGYTVHYSAGGTSAPIPARYLLRSIAAFQSCSAAVFFQPGPGSLAVAREAVRAGLPVFVISPRLLPFKPAIPPSLIPSVSGHWVRSLFFAGSVPFLCWQWVGPSQPVLF